MLKETTQWARDPEPKPPAIFTSSPTDISPFDIELSDFRLLQRGMRYGKGLRLTVTWRFTHAEFGILGVSMEGCMILKTGEGGYRFSPPVSRFGPYQSKQICVITTDFAELILKLVRDKKTKSGNSYFSYIGTEDAPHLRALDPSEVDMELPIDIRLGGEEGESK